MATKYSKMFNKKEREEIVKVINLLEYTQEFQTYSLYEMSRTHS